MADKVNRHYYLDEEHKTIWHTKILLSPTKWFVFIGTSDNPNIKMAAQVFIQRGKRLTGCKIKEYNHE